VCLNEERLLSCNSETLCLRARLERLADTGVTDDEYSLGLQQFVPVQDAWPVHGVEEPFRRDFSVCLLRDIAKGTRRW